jgi:cobalt-zinc-cadmium efflux system membrane fusion protein
MGLGIMICFRLKVETLIIPFRLIPLFLCFNLVQSPIVNDRQVMASANIYEKDLSQIRIGQAVQVKVVGDNTSYVGKVTAIGATIDSTTRVVPVKAEINNAQGKLKVGMFADLEVISDRASQPVIAVPIASVVESNGKQLVFVQNGTKYQPVEVKLGRTSGDLVEVQDGLFEGDLVVIQRANQIYAQSLRGDAQENKGNPNDHNHGSEQGGSTISQGWLVIAIALGAIGGGAIVALAFWLGKRSGTKMVILREPSDELSKIGDRIDR